MDVLGNFYIPEEQSIYLLSANDAQKLKDWIALCIAELEKLGYRDIILAGKGVYGFTFAGTGERASRWRSSFPDSICPKRCANGWPTRPICCPACGIR
ncbi:hypothetical protein MBH78_17050 [Oceanimonas sp. NS1]|nr:hypothetical protein [Oceanimonas sp. NS1]